MTDKRVRMSKAEILEGIDQDDIDMYFKCIVQAYHVLNGDGPIKESMWETVNEEIFIRLGLNVKEVSKGSHKSGADMKVNGHYISNKSGLYKNKKGKFSISSYRLSGVVYENDDDIDPFIEEINKRKNFGYYSFIVREEIIDKVDALEVGKKIMYDWYLIPSDCSELDPGQHEWSKRIGTRGKFKDKCNGWRTEKHNGEFMEINISMSYQLWMHVNKDNMKDYIVSSTTVDVTSESGYFNMYKMLHEANPDKYCLRPRKNN